MADYPADYEDAEKPVTTAGQSKPFVQNAVLMPTEWFNFAAINAWSETVRQYQRTALGPLWLIVGQVVYILGIAWVYSAVFSIDPKELMPYLSSGIITWTFISTVLSTAPSVLMANAGAAGSFQIPFSTFCLQNMLRHLITMFHGLLIHVVVLQLYGLHVTWTVLLFFPGLVLLLACLYPLSLTLGILGARYRDIGPAIGSAVYFMFLITPIIWKPSALPQEKQLIILLNPLHHMMDLIRAPLVMTVPSPTQYLISIGICVALWVSAIATCRTVGRRIIFWL